MPSPNPAEIRAFPAELLLNEPDRGRRLLKEFYQQLHERENPHVPHGVQTPIKVAFFKEVLAKLGGDKSWLGLDVGCRYGHMIRLVDTVDWLGVDLDPKALEFASREGIPTQAMDFMTDIGVQDNRFDAVMMTEVLEHLPYPAIIVREVHRIMKKSPRSVFLGTVPLDYHLHRRWKVLRGKRLSGEQTHIHHFSFAELDTLLKFYFDAVEYKPLSGTASRHPGWRLPYNLFVRDIAWAASSPKQNVGPWSLRKARRKK